MTGKERIVFDRVSMRFPVAGGELSVVENVSFSIRDGEFVSLVGPSGCGKTTMLNMVAGFVLPTAGQVTLDGRKIGAPGPDRGVIFQDYGIFPWLTGERNILFGLTLKRNLRDARERATICERYMALMGLSDFRDAYPKTLSGGMRQRLALARAYAVAPDFLLMDEPFGALDSQTRSAMQDLLLEVLRKEGKTVMLITHSVEEAVYLSHRIVVVTARPSRVRQIIEVPFPYPRTPELRDTAKFVETQAGVRALVMQEYAAQEQQQHPS